MKKILHISLPNIASGLWHASLSIVKSISLISIALIILLSTSGFKISMHFCEDHIYDIGILHQAQSCCGNINHHHSHCADMPREKAPCEDDTLEFQKIDNFVNTLINIDFSSEIVMDLMIFENPVFEIEESNNSNTFVVLNESSPPKSGLRQALNQTFLL